MDDGVLSSGRDGVEEEGLEDLVLLDWYIVCVY